MFHEIKGKNVKFHGNQSTAFWEPCSTGGHVYSAQPLSSDQDMLMSLVGTGGVELGIINEDPAQLLEDFSAYRNTFGVYQFLNDVKIHKRSCKMNVKINYEKQEVTSTYGRGVYTQKLRTDKKYWIVVDVKYGEVEIELQNREPGPTTYSFSHRGGKNIEVLNNPTVARSISKSPAALCIHRTPVKPGQVLTLHSTPRPYQGTTPGRYYVRLFLTELKPEVLLESHPDRFDVTCIKTGTPKWTTIETFEKDDCRGTIILEFTERTLRYTYANGKRNQQDLKNIRSDSNDLWLVVELYGVAVNVKDDSTSGSSNMGLDELDAGALEPRPNSAPTNHNQGSFISEETNESSTLAQNYIHPVPNNTNQTRNLQPGYAFDVPCSEPRQPVACARSFTRNPDNYNDVVKLDKGIRKHFTDLQRSLFVPQVIDLLYENEYVTLGQMEHIRSQGVEQVRSLLIFMTKKPISRRLLERVLEDTGHGHLLPEFLNEVEKD